MKISFDARLPAACRFLLAASLSLAAFVFILGMPWNDLGLWSQVEVPGAAIHALAALCVIALGVLVTTGDERTVGVLRNPVVLLLVALPIFTMAVSPFTGSPLRSINGTLKHGIGALWYFELAVMTAASAVVFHSRLRYVLESALVVSTLSVCGLYMLPQNSLTGVPMSFPEWVGLLCASTAFVVASPARRLLSVRVAVALVVFLAGLWISENRTVVLAAAAALGVAVLSITPGIRGLLARPDVRAWVVVVAGLVGVLSMYALAPILESRALRQPVPVEAAAVLSKNPLDRHAMQDGVMGTLWSRSHMVRLVVRDMLDDPTRLLTGEGWGSFQSTFARHARDIPGRAFPTPVPTASLTYMDSQRKADFHSHNLPIEALLSGGVAAFGLWFATVGAMAYGSRRGMAVATGIVVGGLFWFPTNHMTAAIAALLACAVVPRTSVGKASATLRVHAAIPTAIVAAVLFSYGSQAFMVARVEHAERYFNPIVADRDTRTCGGIKAMLIPSDEINVSLYEVLSQRIVGSKDRTREVYDRTTNVLTLSCVLRSYYEHSDNIVALVKSLEKRALLVAIGPASYGPLLDDIVKWNLDVERLLATAPSRTETIIPYVAALSKRSQNKELIVAEIDRFAAAVAHDDPVYEWLLSQKARITGDEAGYLHHFRRAADMGFGNIVAIPAAQANEIAQ